MSRLPFADRETAAATADDARDEAEIVMNTRPAPATELWLWDAVGPAASACGVAGTREAARSAAGSLVTSGQADTARVEQAAIVVGNSLSYDYCPTGRAWTARLEAGRLTWAPVPRPWRAAS